MNIFTQQRLSASIIALLVVLNMASLGTIWFLQSRQSLPANPKGPEPVKKFLEQELGLTREQAQQFETLRQQHFQASQTINETLHPIKEAIMQEVFAASPDSAKVKTLSAEIGMKQGELEELRFQHFLALKAVCRPEQLEKFQALFHEFFPPPNPQGEGRPPQPGPAPEHGRAAGAGAGAPREALEACQGKSRGEGCQFTTPHGNVDGTCRSVDTQLACVPKNGKIRKPPPAP